MFGGWELDVASWLSGLSKASNAPVSIDNQGNWVQNDLCAIPSKDIVILFCIFTGKEDF